MTAVRSFCNDAAMQRIGAAGLACAMFLVPLTSWANPTLQFEARPAPATDICAAPCYQVRMFVEDRLGELEIQALQMDVRVHRGATSATLPVVPATNANAGNGNIQVRNALGRTEKLPWDLSATVGQSPSVSGPLVVAAASSLFGVASLAALLSETVCLDDPAKCALVADSLARNRIYLGFFNVAEVDPFFGPGQPPAGACQDPRIGDPYCYETAPPGPYFIVEVTGLTGVYSPDIKADHWPEDDTFYFVPLVPEVPMVLLLAGILAMLLPLRMRS